MGPDWRQQINKGLPLMSVSPPPTVSDKDRKCKESFVGSRAQGLLTVEETEDVNEQGDLPSGWINKHLWQGSVLGPSQSLEAS